MQIFHLIFFPHRLVSSALGIENALEQLGRNIVTIVAGEFVFHHLFGQRKTHTFLESAYFLLPSFGGTVFIEQAVVAAAVYQLSRHGVKDLELQASHTFGLNQVGNGAFPNTTHIVVHHLYLIHLAVTDVFIVDTNRFVLKILLEILSENKRC